MHNEENSTIHERPLGGNNDLTLWTVADVAEFLRVSRSWVYRQAAAGVLPCIQVGGLLRFEPAGIRRFVGLTK